MRLGISFGISILLIFPSLLEATLIQDVFRVKTGTLDGGCNAQMHIITEWMDDTSTLLGEVLQGMPANPTTLSDQNMKNNLAAYFGISFGRAGNGQIAAKDIPAYSSVRNYFLAVQELLDRRDPRFNAPEKKPFLFCGSNWLKETETLYNENTGIAVQDPKTRKDASLRTYKPPKSLRGSNAFKQLLADMQEKTGTRWARHAYWSTDVKDYDLVLAKDRFLGTPRSFCNRPNRETMFALTVTKLLVDTVTLCPAAFTNQAEQFESIADALASPKASTAGTRIGDVSPRGLTLFHELFHLVKPDKASLDTATKSTECLQLVTGGKKADARKNPDNFVLFAWSYHLTNRNPQLQWHTGFAVQAPHTIPKKRETEQLLAIRAAKGGSKSKPPPTKPTQSHNNPPPPPQTPVAPPTKSDPPQNPPPQTTAAPSKSDPPQVPATSNVPKSSTPALPSVPPSSIGKTSTQISSLAAISSHSSSIPAISTAHTSSFDTSAVSNTASSTESSATADPSSGANPIIAPVVVGAIAGFTNWQTTGDFNAAEAKKIAGEIKSMIEIGDFGSDVPIGSNGTANATESASIGTALPTTMVTSVRWGNRTSKVGSGGTEMPTGTGVVLKKW